MLDEKTAKEIKADFHAAMRQLRYDMGGSLADLVEDVLTGVLRKQVEKAKSQEDGDL